MDENKKKREKFISNVGNPIEKIFWKKFFEQVDKRKFLKAKFIVNNFGLRAHNKGLFTKPSVSLMYSRQKRENSFFVLNTKTYNDKIINKKVCFNSPKKRLKYFLKEPEIADEFYKQLESLDLIANYSYDGDNLIIISDIVSNQSEEFINELITQFFIALDLFQ